MAWDMLNQVLPAATIDRPELAQSWSVSGIFDTSFHIAPSG